MFEEVYKNIFRIGVELPKTPLKELNAYLVKGPEKSLLIDTGFNQEECRADLFEALNALEVDFKKLDLFITHLHADHSGLAGYFTETSEHIYASKIDAKLMNMIATGEYGKKVADHITLFDLERDNVKNSDHPGQSYAFPNPIDFTIVKEKDVITVGDYQLEVIETAGHTPGLVGLYERNQQLYFSADHVLDRISPNINFWSHEFDSLKTYLANLEKVTHYTAKTIFPSHRNIMHDHPRRAKELIGHHHERLEEVYNILTETPISVRDTASKMTWNIRANSWEEFPAPQKFFATGEAMAHLEYLYNEGKLIREVKDGIYYFARKS